MTFHVEERVTIMKKKLVPILGISFALLLLASGCTSKKESRSDDAQKAVTTEKKMTPHNLPLTKASRIPYPHNKENRKRITNEKKGSMGPCLR